MNPESGEILVAARGDGHEADDVVAVHGDPRLGGAGRGGVEVVAGRPRRDIEAVEMGIRDDAPVSHLPGVDMDRGHGRRVGAPRPT